jgi:hypothetical protein
MKHDLPLDKNGKALMTDHNMIGVAYCVNQVADAVSELSSWVKALVAVQNTALQHYQKFEQPGELKQVDISKLFPDDKGKFVELGAALEKVLELAKQNALTVEDEEGSLAEEAMEQQAAIDTVEDFVVNHLGKD